MTISYKTPCFTRFSFISTNINLLLHLHILNGQDTMSALSPIATEVTVRRLLDSGAIGDHLLSLNTSHSWTDLPPKAYILLPMEQHPKLFLGYFMGGPGSYFWVFG
jgi:hypothetical protein